VPADAVRLIEAVTRRPGEEYDRFIDRIVDHPDRRVILLKLSDLQDNMDPTRRASLAERDPAKAKQLAIRYGKAVHRLEAASAER